MIRQMSLCRRLLVNSRREVPKVCGFLPRQLYLCQYDVEHWSMHSPVIFRMFSFTKVMKEDKDLPLTKAKGEEAKIWALDSVDEVLNAASSEFCVNSVNLLLKRLIELHSTDPKLPVYSFVNDARFIRITDNLAENTSNLSSFVLIDSLHSLLQMSNEDSYVINKLEKEIKAKLLRLSFPQLLRVVQIHRASCDTSLRRLMLEEAMVSLERRWAEIKRAKDLVSVYYLATNEKEKLLSNLEEKALDLSELMSARDIYRFLYLMAKRNRRNAPVMRSLIYHLNRSTLSLSLTHLANLSYACAKLSIYDPMLLGKIVTEVLQCEEGGAFSMISVSSILHSFGLLRWRDTNLMDAAVEKFSARGVSLPVDCWATLLITAGSVNYLPPSLEKKLPALIGWLGELQESDPRLWLNLVWSVATLSVVDESLFSSVLSDNFMRSTKDVHTSQDLVAAYFKLLNVNALAKHCLPGYNGYLLSHSTMEDIVKEMPPPHHGGLSDCLLDTLSNMANLGKYTRTKVKTPAGFFIDAVLVINSSAELQPTKALADFSFSTVDLPHDLHKIAVQLLEFGDMTCGMSTQPTGRCALEAKLMSTAGYKVIQIPFSEFSMTMTVAQRVLYLNAKLKEALKSSEQSSQNLVLKQLEAKIKTSSSRSNKNLATIPESKAISKPSQSNEIESKTSVNTEKSKKSTEHLAKLSIKDILHDPQP